MKLEIFWTRPKSFFKSQKIFSQNTTPTLLEKVRSVAAENEQRPLDKIGLWKRSLLDFFIFNTK